MVADTRVRSPKIGGGVARVRRSGKRRLTRPTEIKVLADDGFEEVTALHRVVEDLG